jgi:hypothetical protein
VGVLRELERRVRMRYHRRQRRLHGGELGDRQRHQWVAGRLPVHLPGLPLGQLQFGWEGQQSSWDTVTYDMTSGATSVSNLDVGTLTQDMVSRGTPRPAGT